jgi:hypothetical protein
VGSAASQRVRVARGEAHEEEAQAGHQREHERLVEDPPRAPRVARAHGLRHERRRPHAERLGQGQHRHHEVAGQADPGQGLLAQPPHEVEVGQEVERLEDGAERDEGRELDDVPPDRALGQVLHHAGAPA